MTTTPLVSSLVREVRKRSTNEWFALKTIEFSRLSLRDAAVVTNESRVLKSVPIHPFLIRHYVTLRDNLSLSFVMDLLSGGDLRTLFRLQQQFKEEQAAYVISCIGSALHHLHTHRIIHRDVKPENIMFDISGIPKLIDFGLSYLAPASISSDSCVCDQQSGTIGYMSPEVMVQPTHYHSYETDFWSLGIVLFEMLFNTRPFENSKGLPHEFTQYSSETYQSGNSFVHKELHPLALILNRYSTFFTPMHLFHPMRSPCHYILSHRILSLMMTTYHSPLHSSFRSLTPPHSINQPQNIANPSSPLCWMCGFINESVLVRIILLLRNINGSPFVPFPSHPPVI